MQMPFGEVTHVISTTSMYSVFTVLTQYMH